MEAVTEVRHYMGAMSCPKCGRAFDPETGYCPNCEDILVLFRVQGYTPDWFEEEEIPRPPPCRVVSRGAVGFAVKDMLERYEDLTLIVVQRQ
jgi:hypothetical protein